MIPQPIPSVRRCTRRQAHLRGPGRAGGGLLQAGTAFSAGYYQNAKVDDFLRKARTTLEGSQRVAMYVQNFKLHPNVDLVLTQVELR